MLEVNTYIFGGNDLHTFNLRERLTVTHEDLIFMSSQFTFDPIIVTSSPLYWCRPVTHEIKSMSSNPNQRD